MARDKKGRGYSKKPSHQIVKVATVRESEKAKGK